MIIRGFLNFSLDECVGSMRDDDDLLTSEVVRLGNEPSLLPRLEVQPMRLLGFG
jgi:hypothetical protein